MTYSKRSICLLFNIWCSNVQAFESHFTGSGGGGGKKSETEKRKETHLKKFKRTVLQQLFEMCAILFDILLTPFRYGINSGGTQIFLLIHLLRFCFSDHWCPEFLSFLEKSFFIKPHTEKVYSKRFRDPGATVNCITLSDPLW